MRKFLFSLILCLSLLFSISYCAPNVYALNNFYSGSGMCFGPSNVNNGSYDESAWVWVTEPTPNTGTANRYKDVCVVSSFSDVIMSGTTDITSVPLVDFDRNIGKILTIPSGTACVIYSRSINDFVSTNGSLLYSVIGYDKPRPTGSTTGRLETTISTSGSSSGVGTLTLKTASSEFNYGNGAYIFLYNPNSTERYVQVADYPSTGYVDITPTPIQDVQWVINTSTINTTTVTYAIPHIKGVADIYVNVGSNLAINQDSNVSIKTYYGNTFTSISSTTLKTFWQYSLISTVTCRFLNTDISVAYSNSSGGSGYYNYDYASYNGCPKFLNNTIYLFPYSVNLNNVQQLAKAIADALASQGGSGGDYDALLRQILSELQLANTGGTLGATVSAGIQALEQQHQTIIDSADFTDFSDSFDDFSYLFDFDNDMHWIITANNLLFGYFAGFIILCCLLLTISRIMR